MNYGTKEFRLHKLTSQDGTVCYVAYGEKGGTWRLLKITEEDILSGRATAFSDLEKLKRYMSMIWDHQLRFSPYSYLPNMTSNEYIESLYL